MVRDNTGATYVPKEVEKSSVASSDIILNS